MFIWEDKGSSFVKMRKDQYIQAGNSELSKNRYYEEINEDPCKVIKERNDVIVDAMIMNDEIPLKVGEFLKDGKSELPKFYHILKTHKIPTTIENPEEWLETNGFPIRGIVSGCNSPTERLGGFVDHFLQDGMKNLESYLKDTKHTLQIISDINDRVNNGEISLNGVALVSLDLESMYTNMTEELGTSACREYLESRSFQQDGEESVSSNSILTALNLCLKNNVLEFNDRLFKQISGVGTGAKFAPTYACLGAGKFEEIMFKSNHEFLEKIIAWKRFIDDVLMLFKGSENQCKQFVNWMNSLIPGVIKFKYEFSFEKVVFLDLEIFIEDNQLKTNLFVKPSNKQIYLDFDSNHPEHCKQSIPYSQALRVVERCSSVENRDLHLSNLRDKLEKRNYPTDLVSKQFEKAKEKDRKGLIFQKRRKKDKKDGKVRLMFTHNRANPPIHQWVRDCKKQLFRNDQAKELGERIQIGMRQPKNLQRLVGGYKSGSRRMENPPPDAGCAKCHKCKVVCPVLKEGSNFQSKNTSKKYKIKQKLTCDSDWLVYLVTCKKCGGQYVGKSKTSFKKRHSNHKVEIKQKRGGLGHHFGGERGCGYENFSVILIEQVEKKNLEFLAEREVFWQNQLRVYPENGSKGHCYRKEKVGS